MSITENITTWSEATDGLTNNERGVLYGLVHFDMVASHNAYYRRDFERTSGSADDVRGYRDGTRITDAKQIRKALVGLEARGLITMTPRGGVYAERTRRYALNSPVRFLYRAEEYERWLANPTGYHSLAWYEVASVTVINRDALREAVRRERDGIANEQANAEVESARKRLDGERDRLLGFVAMLDEYRAKYGDGSLPVEECESYSGNVYQSAADLLGKIEREAKSLRSWIDYNRDGDIATVAAHDAERQAVAA
jgi:hypothetical protein